MDPDTLLKDFTLSTIELPITAIFRGFDARAERQRVLHLGTGDRHQTIFNVATYLLDGGYEDMFSRYEFWDEKYRRFSGHCHQMTPAMGAVLTVLGVPARYKEAYLIRDHLMRSGLPIKVHPQEEPNDAMRAEFCSIGRIPYCALEVQTLDGMKLISPKHLMLDDGHLLAKLTPLCYELTGASIAHQTSALKSGIYLARQEPLHWRGDYDLQTFPIWMKQKMGPDANAAEPAEFFATYKDIVLK